jgi:hypothetical protein
MQLEQKLSHFTYISDKCMNKTDNWSGTELINKVGKTSQTQ